MSGAGKRPSVYRAINKADVDEAPHRDEERYEPEDDKNPEPASVDDKSTFDLGF